MIPEKANKQESESLLEEFLQILDGNILLKIAVYAVVGTGTIYLGGKFFDIAAVSVVSIKKFIRAFE